MELFVAGGCAGLIAKTAVAPLERVKLLNQAGMPGFIRTFRAVYEQEGVRGFWRGNFSNLYRVIPNKAVLFACNDSYRQLVDCNSKSFMCSALSGALAGATADLVTYPLDLSRTREASQIGKSRYESFARTMSLTVREEGFFALYRGLGMTLAACIPYEGIKFGTYEAVSHSRLFMDLRAEHPQYKDVLNLVCGAGAGLTAVLFTYPNDTVRRRLQTQGMDGGQRLYKHGLDCFAKLYRAGGVRLLYAGFTATLIRSIPNTAIQFAAYEWLKGLLLPVKHNTGALAT